MRAQTLTLLCKLTNLLYFNRLTKNHPACDRCIVFRGPGGYFKTVCPIAHFFAFPEVTPEKGDEAQLLVLHDMTHFVAHPPWVAQKFLAGNTMEMDRFPNYHGHRRAFHPAGSQPGYE